MHRNPNRHRNLDLCRESKRQDMAKATLGTSLCASRGRPAPALLGAPSTLDRCDKTGRLPSSRDAQACDAETRGRQDTELAIRAGPSATRRRLPSRQRNAYTKSRAPSRLAGWRGACHAAPSARANGPTTRQPKHRSEFLAGIAWSTKAREATANERSATKREPRRSVSLSSLIRRASCFVAQEPCLCRYGMKGSTARASREMRGATRRARDQRTHARASSIRCAPPPCLANMCGRRRGRTSRSQHPRLNSSMSAIANP